MKTLTIQGVPYAVNDKNEVFLYLPKGSTNHIQIGNYDTSKITVNLFSDWEVRAKPFVEEYRKVLKVKTEAAMEKAKDIQGVSSR